MKAVGRPAHIPTKDLRRLVYRLAIGNVSNEDISNQIGISNDTLLKYYHYELKKSGNRRVISERKKLTKYEDISTVERNDIPKCMSDIDGVKEILFYPQGIYFLVNDDEIVYVGQSSRISRRIPEHLVDKKFNRIFLLVVLDNIDKLEMDYINKFKPKYNKQARRVKDDSKRVY